MVLLTFVVWPRCTRRRIGQMKRERIHPQSVATSAQTAARLTDSRAADNFRNLFELPVLFYLALRGRADRPGHADMLALAWAFVALRVAHSGIQCTYNKVMHRFKVYCWARSCCGCCGCGSVTACWRHERSRRTRAAPPALALPARHARTGPVVRALPRPRMAAGRPRHERGVFLRLLEMRGR